MKTFLIAVMLACFACSSGPQTVGAGHENPVAKLPNPISAPSAAVGAEKADGEATKKPADAAGPRLINFSDVKSSIVLPNVDWQVKPGQNGVAIKNAKIKAFVMLHIDDDARPVKTIAEEQHKALKDSGKFTVKDVVMLADPERALVEAHYDQNGVKAIMVGLVMRNPGDSKQTLMMIGSWLESDDAAGTQVIGIMASAGPLRH